MLSKLYSDLGGDEVVVERFVSDYLSLLDTRIETIRADLHANDLGAIVVSLLSLETTSVMLGADGVVAAAHALRAAVEHSDADLQTSLLEAVLREASALRVELENEGFHPSS